MIARPCTVDDVAEVLEIGRRGHAAGELARFAFDESGAKYLLMLCLTDPGKCAFVAEDDAGVAGIVLGVESPFFYVRATYATDILLYADRAGAGAIVMERFIAWAFGERKVDRIILGETYGKRDPDHAQRWYETLGARRVGGMFIIDREPTP